MAQSGLDFVEVGQHYVFAKTVGETDVDITATVHSTDRTGVEMEALTAVSVAALTLYDMIKAVDPAARIDDIRVLRKDGGRHGTWVR